MKDGKSSLFKVDENGLTSDGYSVLDRSCLKSMYVSRAIAVAVTAVVFYLIIDYAESQGWYPEETRFWLDVLFVVLVVYMAISPLVFYKRYRYRMDDDKIDIRKGILYINNDMVPIERVHQVDVKVGPVNCAFGLADVGITTAGGQINIQFLKEDVAEEIATKLNDKIVRMLKERV